MLFGSKNAICSVYPRVGGGNVAPFPPTHNHIGLSPRGRGKRDRIYGQVGRGGSIPAWAGETRIRKSKPPGAVVYPRVGGGNSVTAAAFPLFDGLSPRGRGKLDGHVLNHLLQRSIPAWAGETGCQYRLGAA